MVYLGTEERGGRVEIIVLAVEDTCEVDDNVRIHGPGVTYRGEIV